MGVRYGGIPWAGAVVFDRSDLDEPAFRRDLLRSVSDDGTLGDHLEVTAVDRTRTVPVGGTLRATLERHVRFQKLVLFYDAQTVAIGGAASVAGAVGAVAAPLPALLLATLIVAVVYAAIGVRRWTALLALPSLVASGPLLVYALARRTFVWGGRRYRWRGKRDVSVVADRSGDADR